MCVSCNLAVWSADVCRHYTFRLAKTWRLLKDYRYVLACEEHCHDGRELGHSDAVACASTVRTVLQRR